MKILHLVGGDLSGGAAKGAYILHQGLLKLGVNSKVLTNSKEALNDKKVASITQSKKEKVLNLMRPRLDYIPLYYYRNRQYNIFSNSFIGCDFTRHPLYQWADIINLHWVNNGFVRIKDISKVKKPIVWTMRDMWPMTGGCHYTMGCENYLYGCGKCPQLNSNNKHDLSAFNIKRKQKYLTENIVLIGISNWLSECAMESFLFKNHRVETFYNNIDKEEYFPVDKVVAKEIIGIPSDKKVVLAGATNISDFYKGFDKYIQALEHLNEKSKCFFLFFGKFDKSLISHLKLDHISLGFLNDTISLRLAYSAADVFVAPSVMDAFGKTLAEAMACGTPVVAFNATGPKDIVNHNMNGYLAEPYNPSDLARGIEWVLNHSKPEKLASSARQKVVESFDMEVIAGKYKSLYEELL